MGKYLAIVAVLALAAGSASAEPGGGAGLRDSAGGAPSGSRLDASGITQPGNTAHWDHQTYHPGDFGGVPSGFRM